MSIVGKPHHAAAIAGAATLALLLSGCTAFGPIIAEGTSSATATPSASPPPNPSSSAPSSTPSSPSTVDSELPVVGIEDRPLYPVAATYVTEMFAKYSDRASQSYAYLLVPDTQAGNDYAHGFLLILADLKSVFAFLPGSEESRDVGPLDAQLQEYIDRAAETERKFLAGEPMGVTMKITNSDGSVFESDGTNTPFD